jgi:hypothetical protein
MSYGNKSNRQLLSVFGFALSVNKYNYARVKVYLSQLIQDEMLTLLTAEQDRPLKFKLRPNCICKGKV